MKNIFLFSLILFTISSCKKPVEEYYLPNELKLALPFKGYETITYTSVINNSIELKADERIDEIKKYYTDHTDSEYILSESSSINFSNEDYLLKFFMGSEVSTPKGIYFIFSYKKYNYDYFSSYFGVLDKNDTINFLDSLFVNGSWIPEIYCDSMKYVLLSKPFPEDSLVFPVKSYYSTKKGVVRIDFSDSTSWELESIEW
jgi:hypothetical protein